jgi:DNA-binding SARP family transcriptional activator
VELGVLGPLEVVSDGVRVALGGPKQRLVLGLLAARRGRVVALDDLIDGLWPDGPQARPRKTVQVYITRLRRAFGEQADAIRSEAAGYRFDPALVTVDADRFAADLSAGIAEPDDERAVGLLRGALARWRGDAFDDLRDCVDLVPSAVQLDEQRLAAMHELFEREVRRRPREILAELEQAVEANPLHEGFAAQLMTAQYRAGRQADALSTFRTLRRRLRDELGLEPGPAVRELEGRILRHDLPSPAGRAGGPVVLERQRRRVTVVSVDIVVAADGPVDPEDELALVAPVRRAVRAGIVERGGVILTDSGDGLSACFGYPSAERAVERAVLAAVSAREAAAEPIEVRVGVDTGVVVIEGGDGVLESIAGEPLRAATRLRALADAGEVLLGRATATAAVDLVTTTPVPGSDAVVAGALLDAGRADPPADGLVGRERALEELASIASRSASRFVPVVVSGIAGIGKTALVERFTRERGAEAVWLHCDRRHHATPLHAMRPVLPELFDAGGEPTVRAVIAALRRRWGDAEPLLVVDDVDAADPSTLDLLDALPEHVAHGMLLLTTRATEPVEVGGDVVARIALGPLDRAASRAVAANVAAPRRLRLETLNEIADRAGGVPLHVQVLTRAVLEPDGSTSAVPTSLYGSLMSALDRLGPARSAAQRLAVLGPSFDPAEVDYVLGGDAVGSRDDVDVMVAAGVLRLEHGQYRFASELIAETAYESLLVADRTALHARVAAALRAGGAPPEPLAFHLEAAGRPFDAAVAWRRASADAVRRARHREAIHHARRAVQILDELDASPDGDDTRRRALTNLAIGLQAISHGNDELLGVVAEARRAGVGRDDLGRRLVLDMMEVSALHERGEFVAATRIAERLAEETIAVGDEVSSAFALQFLGACHVWRGRLASGTEALERSAALFDASGGLGPVGVRAEGALWSLLGLVACFEDRVDDASRLLDRARAVIPPEDGYTRCLVAATGAMADQLADDPATVRAAVEPVWALAMDLGSDFWFSWAQALLGWAVAADDAAAGLAMMAETVDSSSTRQTRPYFLALLGDRLCEHGRTADGIARLDEGLAEVDRTDERLWEPLLRITRAQWMLASGDPAGEHAAQQAVGLALRAGQPLLARRHREWVARRG